MNTSGYPVNPAGSDYKNKRDYHFFHKIFLALIIITVISIPLMVSPPVQAVPAIGISVNSGTPGSTAVISGSDFVAGDSYSIVFGPTTGYEQVLVTNTTVVAGPAFSQTITIPEAPYAQFTIRVDTNRGSFTLAFQVTPHIELQSTTGNVGNFVTVTGAGFRALTAVNINFGSTTIAAISSDTFGSLTPFTITVPVVRSGSYTVYGTDTLAVSPQVFFSVLTRLSTNIIEGKVGDRIVLSGNGFEYNSPLTFYWSSQTISSIQISSSNVGNFTAEFIVPAAARGSHSIKVVDNSARQATVIFTVDPNFIINPANSNPGSTIAFTGTGFRANVNITITFGGNTVVTQPAALITDGNGSFSGTFIVPNITAGSYAVRASDDANAVTANLGIISIIGLTPAGGSVGATVQVTGTGFTPLSGVSLSYDSAPLLTVTADASGSFTATFKVPVSKAGAHVISARDLSSTALVTTATFTMESTPPPKPNLLAPESGKQASVTPKFAWSEVSDPSGVTYNLQVASDSAFTSVLLARQGLTTSGYEVTQNEMFGLVKNTTPFYWRAKAVDGAGNEGEWTSTASFYTQDSTPPSSPLIISPQNDTQAEVRPLFKWSDVTDVSGVTYGLQISRDIGFTNLVIQKTGLTTSNYQVAQTEQLELVKKLAPYYWRVKASDGVGNESAWTTPVTFYTQDSTPPAVPVSLKPALGSSQGGEALFSWSASTDSSGVTYTLQVSQDSNFTRLIAVKEGLTATEYKLSKQEKLEPSSGTTAGEYYWRVKAIDTAQNESDWSNTNSFTVKSFFQSGWPIYIAAVLGGLLLLALGIFIGMKIKPKEKPIA